jgi:hypothetical protein
MEANVNNSKNFSDKMKRFYLLSGLIILASPMSSTAATNYYVATNGPGGAFTNWATAASNIQDAIDRTIAGDVVWVSNGIYSAGGVTNCGYASNVLTNRVAIWKAITVRSANNDPTNTIIMGAKDPGTGSNGPAAVRCVYMTNGSSLIGFTLTNGATLPGTANFDTYGGGVMCKDSTSPIISNCVITGNSAGYVGAGVNGGTLNNCTVIGNSGLQGGGAEGSYLNNCLIISNRVNDIGGGVYFCTLSNCTLTGNSAPSGGGGAQESTLYNCLITGNSSWSEGSAAYGTLYNCTVVRNLGYGGGVSRGTYVNCIIYFNFFQDWAHTTSFTNCCAPGLSLINGNITNNPMFVDTNAGNYRLQSTSPCINVGLNQTWMYKTSDLDGAHHRIDGFSHIVDMGCYEYLPSGVLITIP